MRTLHDVLAIAATEVGTKESPANSNRQKYGAEFGANGVQWCAIFLWWVLRKAGFDPYKTAWVPALMAVFVRTKSFYSSPKVGDIAFYRFEGNVADHCGIIESVSKTGLVTIEGNTALNNQQNGGAVMRRNRPFGSYILGYGRLDFTPDVPEVKVKPEHQPPIVLEPIVAELACPTGGVWLLAASGAVYAFGGAPFRGGAHGEKYFDERSAARLEAGNGGHLYTIVATSGERYDY